MIKLQKIGKFLLPIIIFLSLTLIVNHAIVTGFTRNIEENDGRLLAWTLAWDDHKILTDPLTIFQANIYYPNTNTLTYSEHGIGISLLALPAYILSNGNPIIGFNFVMLLSYFLNAYFTYLLVKYFTKRRAAGIIAGIIYGFCSYKILNFGHLQNMVIFYMPMLVLLMYKYFDTKKIKFLIGIGLCLLLQSLSSWYHMIFIFLLFGIFGLFFIYMKKLTRKDFIRFGVMLIPVFLVILPFALPYFAFNKENQSAYKIDDLKTYSADFGGYLLPSPNTFLGSQVLPKLGITKKSWWENFNFIGYIALILSIISVVSIKKNEKGKWRVKLDKTKSIFVICGAVFFVLSFGPFLRFNDVTTRIPLPYYLVFKFLTPIRFIRAVARFSTVVFLMISILSGFGYLKLEKKLKKKSLSIVLLALTSIFIMLEYYPFNDYRTFADVSVVPEIYKEVKENSDVKAIAVLPIDVGPFVTTGYIYWAGYHLKPIVNGYSGYEPPTYANYRSLITQFPDSLSLAKLYGIGVTHIVLTPEFKGSLSDTYLTLVKEAEGYKLYKIKDNIKEARFYYDNFETSFSQNFEDLKYINNGTEINHSSENTPITNTSPTDINKQGNFEIVSNNSVNKLSLNFRAFTDKDIIGIECNPNQKYSFKNIPELYLKEPIRLDCNSKDIKITMTSDIFKDRAMITMIALE